MTSSLGNRRSIQLSYAGALSNGIARPMADQADYDCSNNCSIALIPAGERP